MIGDSFGEVTESWRAAGAYNDDVRDTGGLYTGGQLTARLTAERDRHTWSHVESLVTSIQAADRSKISRAIDSILGLPRQRLIGVKQALRIGIWGAATTAARGEPGNDALSRLSEATYPMASVAINVDEPVVRSVLGDAIRVFHEERATYSVPEGEFLIVAGALLAALIALDPTSASDLKTLSQLWDAATSDPDPAAARSRWLAQLEG